MATEGFNPADDLGLGQTLRGFIAGQKLFKRYTLKHILGRGGMGVVWLARDEELERDVAMKFLPELVATDRLMLGDLKRETRKSLELTHANIVRIYDFISDQTCAAISMEYVEGSTLSHLRLDQPGQVFAPEQLTEWLRHLCAALDYAHQEAKVVHRDLKPANIMVNARGHLKVTDFGIARSLSDSVSQITMKQGVSGTLLYMSPQQAMGERSTRTDDIYSVGATLYELLTSKPPFYTGEVLAQLKEKTAPSLTSRREELGIEGKTIPVEWEQTIAACLAKDPGQRPQSAGEILERLSLSSATARGKGTTPTTVTEMAPPAPPKRKAAWMGLVIIAIALLGLAGWYFGALLPREKQHQADLAAANEARAAAEKAQQKAEAETKLLADEKAKVDAAALAAKEAAEKIRLAAETEAKAREEARLQAEAEAKKREEARLAAEAEATRLAEEKAKAETAALEAKRKAEAEAQARAEARSKIQAELKRLADEDALAKTEAKAREQASLQAAVEAKAREDARQKAETEAKAHQAVRQNALVGLIATSIANDPKIRLKTEAEAKARDDAANKADAEARARDGARLKADADAKIREEARIKAEVELKLLDQAEASARSEAQTKFTAETTLSSPPTKRWTNSLGQIFAPVPGTAVLFSIWETRVRDYAAFADANPEVDGSWRKVQSGNVPVSTGPDYPVVMASWDDAKSFCAWLTKKEQADGRIQLNQSYRLPTDLEWSAAVGLTNEMGGLPEERDGKILGVYPWGTQWPPPPGAGNFADSKLKNVFPNWTAIEGYDDGYVTTAPVGSFKAHSFGLFDLSGNVWQWCEDGFDHYQKSRVLRGGSWVSYRPDYLLSSYRYDSTPDYRNDEIGFRVVLAGDSSAPAPTVSGPAASSGDIIGKVTLSGTPPDELRLPFDDICGRLRPDGATTLRYVVGQDHGLANVFVYISKGLEGRTFPVPAQPAEIDQQGCLFHPYVTGVMVGQALKIKNSDPVMHNVHGQPRAAGNQEFNSVQPNQGMVDDAMFIRNIKGKEILVKLKCNVHPWMFAYVGVVEHPFFAVTDAKGNFKIPNVPAGEYTLTAYHLKTHGVNSGLSQTVKVETGQTAVNFEIKLP